MRLALVADLHGHLPAVPECDVLVIGGDVTPPHDHDVAFQARWLDSEFRAWLDAAPATEVVGIAGNHDFVFENAPETVPGDLRWTYLEDEAAEVGGLRFWGSPWTPWFFDWAFNAPKGDADEEFLGARYAGVPDAADVLVVHGPPRGYGDRTASGMDVGSTAFLETIDRVRPAVCLFGHIHEGRGRWDRDGIDLVNAAAVNLQYELVADPFVVVDL